MDKTITSQENDAPFQEATDFMERTQRVCPAVS